MPGWIGFSSTIDSISTNGSADAAQQFHASFTVHDGTIWRDKHRDRRQRPQKEDAKGPMRQDSIRRFRHGLSLSVPGVTRDFIGHWRTHSCHMGGAEGLAGHPYYKVGRPGGCKIQLPDRVVYYSTHTPPAEIERLTSYDFSCFTRFNPCKHIEDLLPAAKEWHLYDNEDESSPTVLCRSMHILRILCAKAAPCATFQCGPWRGTPATFWPSRPFRRRSRRIRGLWRLPSRGGKGTGCQFTQGACSLAAWRNRKYPPSLLGQRCFAVQRRRTLGSRKTIHRVCHRKRRKAIDM